MGALKQCWENSFLCSLFGWIAAIGFPAAVKLFRGSFLFAFINRIRVDIVESRPMQAILDPTYLTDACYDSLFYRSATRHIRKACFYIPRASIRWQTFYLGAFLAVLLLLPESLFTGWIITPLFVAVSVLYFSHHAAYRSGLVYAFLSLTIILFLLIAALALPYASMRLIGYFLLGIHLFFLVSSTVRSKQDFQEILGCLFLLLIALCCIAAIQQVGSRGEASATLGDGTTFGAVIVLLFPFSYIAPIRFQPKLRRIIYFILLLALTFIALAGTLSKAAFLGLAVELVLMAFLIDRRLLLGIAVVLPLLPSASRQNLIRSFTIPTTYGNFFTNLIYSFRDFWANGFGINRQTFLDYYNSTALDAKTGQAVLSLPYLQINPVYYTFLANLGLIFLIIFLSYVLRLAHTTLTASFTAKKDYRPFFAAGFATLVGISVSAMLDSTLLNPRMLLLYWAILGLLRAARIIRFGIIK